MHHTDGLAYCCRFSGIHRTSWQFKQLRFTVAIHSRSHGCPQLSLTSCAGDHCPVAPNDSSFEATNKCNRSGRNRSSSIFPAADKSRR